MTHLRRAIVLLFFSCCIAPLAIGQTTFKVKIQSTPMERQLLFAKLTHFNIEGEPFVSVTQIITDRD